MRKILWLFVIRWIQKNFVGKTDEQSSTIVDCCVYLDESLGKREV